jgi:cobalt/nickel transport system permease protein
MHIPDGFLDPYVCTLTYIISAIFLFWAWRKMKATYPRAVVPLLATSSAFVFAAQMLNFPIAYGTSGHLVGGTFLVVLLGPHAAMLSMTIVLLIQAIFFADGGISTFGANVLNMAILGAVSFYLVKIISGSSASRKRFLASIFAASWISVVSGALLCGLEIGVSPIFASAGGLLVTVPAMLFWHTIIGVGEAAITTSIISQLVRVRPTVLNGLAIMGWDIR